MWQQYRLDLMEALAHVDEEKVRQAAELLFRAQFQNATVYLVGNGGSAATASHFANDLVKACGLRAVSLPDQTAVVTAYGNDHGWDQMYANLLNRLLLPQDVVVGISCSGNSKNVVNALKAAKQIHYPSVKTMALIGADPECQVRQLHETPEVVIDVQSLEIKIVEDVHVAICHSIAESLIQHAPRQAACIL